MTLPVILYFTSILLTAALSGFLAVYAWRQRSVSGSRAYARLALTQCVLALTECLSLLSPGPAPARFWFDLRVLVLAAIPVLWLLFALEYGGWRSWLSRPLVAGLFVVPVLTQALYWSNSRHGLWVKQDVGFVRNGPFWLADIGVRIPGPGFLAHSFYGLLLLGAGIGLLFVTAWRMRRRLHGQALLLAGAGLIALVFALISVFNLLPRAAFNFFTPGIGASVLLIALGVFRFQLFKHAPAAEVAAPRDTLAAATRRSLAVFLLIFVVMAAGIGSGAYLSFQAYERQFRSQVEAQLSAIAELKVNELNRWRAERLGDALVIRENPLFAASVERYLRDAADAQALSALQGWLDSLRRAYRYDQIFLLDPAGAVRLASPTSDALAAPHLAQETAAALSTGQVTWLDFHRHAADTRVHLSLLVPIDAASSGQPLGLLVLHIDPTVYLYPFIQEWPVPSATAETLLVRRDGDAVVFLNALKFQADAALNLRRSLTETQLPAVQAVLGREGVIEGTDYRGAPVIADVRPVPDSPWFLVTKVNAAEVYAPLQERVWSTVVLFSLLLLAAGIGLAHIWRQQRVRFYRRQAEVAEALRESHWLLNATGLMAKVGGWEIDARTRAVSWTETTYRIHEVPPDYRPNLEDAINFFAPEDRDKLAAAVERALTRGEPYDMELSVITAQGNRLWTRTMCLPQVVEGKTTKLIGAFQDITERKRAEEALRESEQRYRSLVQYAPEAIFVNLQDRVVLVNRACLALFGAHNEAELLGKSIYDLFDPDFHADIHQRIAILRDQGEPVPVMAEKIVRLDGGPVDVEVTAAPFPFGGVNAIHVLLRDITARKEAEQRIADSLARERFLGNLVRDTSVAIGVGYPDGSLGMCNPAFQALTGYSEEELKRVSWSTVLTPPEWLAREKDFLAELHRTKQPVVYEKEYIHKSGRRVPIELVVHPILDAAGHVSHYYAFISDISERKRQAAHILATQAELQRLLAETEQSRLALLSVVEDLQAAEAETRRLNAELEARVEARTRQLYEAQEQLIQQERLAVVGQLAGGMGHELRNPLGVISNASYYLQLIQPDAPSKVKEYLGIIDKEVRTAEQIISDLLDLTHTERGNRARASVHDLAHDLLARLPAPAGVRVTLALPPDLPGVFVNPHQIAKALGNLVVNAYQAMPKGGELTLKAEEKDGTTAECKPTCIALSVHDTGVGIRPEHMSKLFDPIFTTKSTRGFGLGLPISKKLIEVNGGHIEFHSAPGAGSVFTIYLPVAANDNINKQ